MATIKSMSNEQLLTLFKEACFQITNYPKSTTKHARFVALEKELKARLNISREENKKMTAIKFINSRRDSETAAEAIRVISIPDNDFGIDRCEVEIIGGDFDGSVYEPDESMTEVIRWYKDNGYVEI